jgi:hypothetical protein
MEFVLSPSLGPHNYVDTYAHASDLPECCNTFWNVKDFTMSKAKSLEHQTRNSVIITTTVLEPSSACMPNLGSFPWVPESRFGVCARTFTYPSTRTRPWSGYFDSSRRPRRATKARSGDHLRHASPGTKRVPTSGGISKETAKSFSSYLLSISQRLVLFLRSQDRPQAPSANASRLDLD